ncbi:hypothetical protein U9M48_012779 [Paspalum notatum var. saurae]|uniref:Uncharacterized protein n=1 Tax=Paspalum notatum var. saurae TaxID=547442 RepID=A0AAQ3SYA8_PASNO
MLRVTRAVRVAVQENPPVQEPAPVSCEFVCYVVLDQSNPDNRSRSSTGIVSFNTKISLRRFIPRVLQTKFL